MIKIKIDTSGITNAYLHEDKIDICISGKWNIFYPELLGYEKIRIWILENLSLYSTKPFYSCYDLCEVPLSKSEKVAQIYNDRLLRNMCDVSWNDFKKAHRV